MLFSPVKEILKLKDGQAAIYTQGENLWTVEVEAVKAIELDEYQSQAADSFSDTYDYVSDTQDLLALFESEAAPYIRGFSGDCWNVTAAFVRVRDGEYEEVWVTENSKPYLRTTVFSCVLGCSSSATKETHNTKPRYILTKWRSGDILTANDILRFIDKLDAHTAEFKDADWDSFWGGDIYVHLWDREGFREVNPADLIVGAYIAADEINHFLFDKLYRRWLTPSPLGVSLKTEDETVKEVYEFVMEELTSPDEKATVINLDVEGDSELRYEQAFDADEDNVSSPYENVVEVIDYIFDALGFDADNNIGLIRKQVSQHQRDLINQIVDESNTLGYAKGWRYNQLHTLALEARYVVHPIYINNAFDIIDSCSDVLRPATSLTELLEWLNDDETDSIVITDVDDTIANHNAGLTDTALSSFHDLLEDAQKIVLQRILRAFAVVVWDEYINPSKPDSGDEEDKQPEEGNGSEDNAELSQPDNTSNETSNPLYRVLVYNETGRFVEEYVTNQEAIAAAMATKANNLACVERIADKALVYRNELWRKLYPDAYDIEACLGHIIRAEQARHQLTKQSLASIREEANELQHKLDKLNPSHNGYANRSTWLTSLWLDNDYGLYTLLKEWAEDVDQQHELADRVKDFIEDGNPLADDASVYADLLGYAIALVDFHEIVEAYWQERDETSLELLPQYKGYATSDEMQFRVNPADVETLNGTYNLLDNDDEQSATLISSDKAIMTTLLHAVADGITEQSPKDYQVLAALGLHDVKSDDVVRVQAFLDAEIVDVLRWMFDNDAVHYMRTLVRAAQRELPSNPLSKSSKWLYEYLHHDKGLTLEFTVAETIAKAIMAELPPDTFKG
jgi:hypothetical protein